MLNEHPPPPTMDEVLLALLSLALLAGCGWVVLSTTLGLIRCPTKPVPFVSIFGLLFSLGSLLTAFGHLDSALWSLPLVSALLVAWGFCVALWCDCKSPFLSTFDDSAAAQIKDLRDEVSTLRKFFNEYTAMLANKVRAMGLELHAKDVAFDQLCRANSKTVAALKKELSDARKLVKAEKQRAIEARKHDAEWHKMELSGLRNELDRYKRSLDALRAGRPNGMDEEILARFGDKFLFGDRLRLMDLTDRQKMEIRSFQIQTDDLRRRLADSNATRISDLRQEISLLSRTVAAQVILSDQSAFEWELQFAAVDHQRKLAESNSRDLEVKLQSLRRKMYEAAESQKKELSRAQDKASCYMKLVEQTQAERDQAKSFFQSAEQERRAAIARADSLSSKVDELTEELKILRDGCCLCLCPCCPDGCSPPRSGTASPSPVPVPVPVPSPSPSPSPELASLRQELARLRAENETLRQPVPSSSPSPELASLHQELARLRGENQELGRVHGENESLRQQIAALSQENTTARGLMGQAEGQWANLQDTARRLESELAASRQEASSATARANHLAEQLSRQVALPAASPAAAPAAAPVAAPAAPPAAPVAAPPADQMLLAQQKIDQLTKRAEQTEQKLQETLDKLDAADSTLETYRNAPSAVSFEERNAWAMERGYLTGLVAGHDATVARLTRDRENLEADLEEAQDDLEQAKKAHKAEIDNLEDIMQEFQERIDELGSIDDEIERLQEENDELKEDLKEAYETLGYQ